MIDGERFSDGKQSPENTGVEGKNGSDCGLLTILATSKLVRAMIFALSFVLVNCGKPASDSVSKSREAISSEVANYFDNFSKYQQIIEEGELLLSIFVTHFDLIKSRPSLSEVEKRDLQRLIREYQVLFQKFQSEYQRIQSAILTYDDKTRRMQLEELETHFRLIREPLADLITKIHAIFTRYEGTASSFDRACDADDKTCL